jgi:hypothetical protein
VADNRPSIDDRLVPLTRLSVAPVPLLNWTVLPWPIEKPCQSMIALPELWLIVVVAPLVDMPAEPATTLPPEGRVWACATVARRPSVAGVMKTRGGATNGHFLQTLRTTRFFGSERL